MSYRIVLSDQRTMRMSILRETHDERLAESLLSMVIRTLLATDQSKRYTVTLDKKGGESIV